MPAMLCNPMMRCHSRALPGGMMLPDCVSSAFAGLIATLARDRSLLKRRMPPVIPVWAKKRLRAFGRHRVSDGHSAAVRQANGAVLTFGLRLPPDKSIHLQVPEVLALDPVREELR